MKSEAKRSMLVAGVLSLLLVGAWSPLSAQTPSGCWAGTLAAGANASRAALELRDTGSGWTGAIHRLGRTIDSDSLLTVSVDGSTVAFTFPSTLGTGQASFEGTVEDGVLSGTILSAGVSLPASLDAVDPATPDPARDLVGYWNGGLFQGGVRVLRLRFEISPAACGQVFVVMDSPDQGAEDIAVSAVSFDGDSLMVAVASLGGNMRASVSPARDSLDGLWTQGPGSLLIRLARGDGPVSYARPQEPEAPFPYEAVEVSYVNERDGTEFAGTLTVPEGPGPFPAALLITGSGAQDRDETLMGHRPFLVIADYLTRRGVAVLRVDDRGVGGSSGNVMNATIDDTVGDALAAIAFLRTREDVDADRIGLIGHSEGGWVAPAAATRSDDVAFVVMLAGPAVTGQEIILAQNRAIMEASGVTQIEREMDLVELTVRAVMEESDPERVQEIIREGVQETLAAYSDSEREAFIEQAGGEEALRARLDQGVGQMTTVWYRSLLVWDPVPYLESMDVPVLALFGTRDLQVPAEQSAPILERIWSDHADATVMRLPELNHLFQHAETGLLQEYAEIEETFSPEALETIGDWILARFGRP